MEQLALTVTNNSNNLNKKLSKFQNYLYCFFMFSFLGWLMETVYSYIVLGHFTNRGFFYGPLCPMYGCGSLLLILFLTRYKNKPIKLFIVSIVVFSVFEYIIGYSLDALYGVWLWDYNIEFLNLNGRICLFYSLAWGFVALIFAYIIFPLFDKVVNFLSSKINIRFQLLFLRLISIIFIIDILYSFIEYSNL